MSKPVDFYWSDDMRRSIQEIKNLSLKSGNEKFGCNHPPLLNIPLQNIVPDELHLMLRITGIICNICYFRCKKVLNNYRYNQIILEINGSVGCSPCRHSRQS
jgi:hypothetical protein